MRRAEEESENISVNLLRRLSSAQKKLAETEGANEDASSSDEDVAQAVRGPGNHFTKSTSNAPTLASSPHSSGVIKTLNTTSPPHQGSTPLAQSQTTFGQVQDKQHLVSDKVPLTPRVRQVAFSPPLEAEADAEHQGASDDLVGNEKRGNSRRWSMADTGSALVAQALSTVSERDAKGRTCGAPHSASSPPSPCPRRRRPGTPIPPIKLRPTLASPILSPLTPLQPLDEERKRHRDDLQAWKMWGLQVWGIAKQLKLRIADLEQHEQNASFRGDPRRKVAVSRRVLPCTASLVRSPSLATYLTLFAFLQPLSDIEIPPPPSMLSAYSRVDPFSGPGLLRDAITPSRMLHTKRPVLKVKTPSEDGETALMSTMPFVPPSLAIHGLISPSNITDQHGCAGIQPNKGEVTATLCLPSNVRLTSPCSTSDGALPCIQPPIDHP